MKILVADDDVVCRTLLSGLLGKWGHEVQTATDGERAWEAITHPQAPKLVILDWLMPGLDGLALCRKIRAHDQRYGTYIILVSSKGERGEMIQGLEAGADDYIVKPFDQDELLARVRVGLRVIELQARLMDQERLSGVLEMAGAVCHEMNQPLQVVMGASELLLLEIPEDDPHRELLRTISTGVARLGEVTRRIMNLSHSMSTNYAGERQKIVDIYRGN